MTPQEIDRVAATLVEVDLDALASDFYAHLFDAHPEVRSMFPSELQDLRAKFVDELEAIVEAISDLDRFLARTRELGERHVAYGVTTPDYALVGEALVWAFEQRLTHDPETVAAWRAAYVMVAQAMMEGADSNPFARETVEG